MFTKLKVLHLSKNKQGIINSIYRYRLEKPGVLVNPTVKVDYLLSKLLKCKSFENKVTMLILSPKFI